MHGKNLLQFSCNAFCDGLMTEYSQGKGRMLMLAIQHTVGISLMDISIQGKPMLLFGRLL